MQKIYSSEWKKPAILCIMMLCAWLNTKWNHTNIGAMLMLFVNIDQHHFRRSSMVQAWVWPSSFDSRVQRFGRRANLWHCCCVEFWLHRSICFIASVVNYYFLCVRLCVWLLKIGSVTDRYDWIRWNPVEPDFMIAKCRCATHLVLLNINNHWRLQK